MSSTPSVCLSSFLMGVIGKLWGTVAAGLSGLDAGLSGFVVASAVSGGVGADAVSESCFGGMTAAAGFGASVVFWMASCMAPAAFAAAVAAILIAVLAGSVLIFLQGGSGSDTAPVSAAVEVAASPVSSVSRIRLPPSATVSTMVFVLLVGSPGEAGSSGDGAFGGSFGFSSSFGTMSIGSSFAISTEKAGTVEGVKDLVCSAASFESITLVAVVVAAAVPFGSASVGIASTFGLPSGDFAIVVVVGGRTSSLTTIAAAFFVFNTLS
mmetsp:Transcript_34735/g.40207  ORF Transcript_34735/g.40207 Transcript_34735/m.40207 type:complete len:267 (+) Transcript_34735:235-1035(+)